MRLWSLHPGHLDARGLTALWREGLLAQRVLQGRTRGYTHHPQLERFREGGEAEALIASYLLAVWQEASQRGYRFDASRIGTPRTSLQLPVTEGQIEYEWRHLLAKLQRRAPAWYAAQQAHQPRLHPLFYAVPGARAAWEHEKAG
jgi:hypothetical protein